MRPPFHILFNKRGNATLLGAFIVTGTLVVLGTIAQMQSRNITAENVQRLNQRESFYTGEMIAWHNYVRNKDSFAAPSSMQSDGRYAVSLPLDYTVGVPQVLVASPYLSSNYQRGAPLNVKTTQAFDSVRSIVRRQEESNIRYSVPNAGKFCAGMSFGKGRFYETCLTKATSGVLAGTLPKAFAVGHPKIGYRVDGFYVSQYQYALISNTGSCSGATFSATRPRLNADGSYNEIDLSSQAAGNYKLCVLGISSKGVVQYPATEYVIGIPAPIALPAPQGILCDAAKAAAQLKDNKHPTLPNTYVICSPNHFDTKMFSDVPDVKVKNVPTKNLVLGQDIDFAAIKNYRPLIVTSFVDLDGRGYRFKNLTSQNGVRINNYGPFGSAQAAGNSTLGVTVGAGLFAITYGLKARNLYIDDFKIAASGSYDSSHIGTLAGSVSGNVDISDVYVNRTDVAEGGLLGSIYGGTVSIANVSITGKVIGGGGLINYLRASNSATISISNVYAEVDFANSGGGLIGQLAEGGLTLANSGYKGTIERSGLSGGLIRYVVANTYAVSPATIVKDCYAKLSLGKTWVANTVGGLIGEARTPLQMSNSVALVTMDAKGSDMVGGAIGRLAPDRNSPATLINNVRVAGLVKGRASTGGFIGSYEGITQGSLSTFIRMGLFMGQVIADNLQTSSANTFNTLIGGFVGDFNGGVIENSMAIADVQGTYAVGGFAGLMEGTGSKIDNSLFFGSVTAKSAGTFVHSCGNIAGFVGRASGTSLAVNASYTAANTVIVTARLSGGSPAGYTSGIFGGSIGNGVTLTNLFSVGTLQYPSLSGEGWFMTPSGTSFTISGTSGLSYLSEDKSASCVPSTHKTPSNCTQFSDVKNIYKQSAPTTLSFDNTKWFFPGTSLPYLKGM